MSWTNLFKSKSKLKPDPRVRWFGKLPTYPDYYSSQKDEDWVVEFNDWILKGFEIYQSRLRSQGVSVARLPVSGCAVRLPNTGMTVFASFLDYGGDMQGRPFPLSFYSGVPTSCWPGPTSDRLVDATGVIRELLMLRRHVPRFINSPGRFESTFGDRTVDLGNFDELGSDASWVTSAGALIIGPVVSWTVTFWVAVDVLPDESVAVKVTCVVPN